MNDQVDKKKKIVLPGPRWNLFHHVGKDPYIDWMIVLVSSIAIFIILTWVDITTYANLDERLNQAVAVTISAAPASIDLGKLKKFVDDYDIRASLRAEILKTKIVPGDPSM